MYHLCNATAIIMISVSKTTTTRWSTRKSQLVEFSNGIANVSYVFKICRMGHKNMVGS